MGGELAGRVAIVTGGARGIGLAIAEDLVRHGANVVIVDSGVTIGGEAEAPNVALDAAAKLQGAVGIAGDVADAATAQAAVKTAIERFGGVDVVVNNAAIIRDGFIFKANLDAWDQVIRTNLTGAFRLLAAATPVMREAIKGGRAAGAIVNIVSTAGIYGNFGQAAYAAAKNGLIGLTRVVAHDLARAKITCNAIAPFAATRVTESIQPANDAQAAYKKKALQVSPVYVARLVSFLASPGAVAISGQLFGARGRELFLFSQPRPKIKVAVPAGGHDLTGMAGVMKHLEPDFTDLVTDLEAFSGDPLL
jgi:NAD(P)-dependent dehydrogenase (short-subunit alcohol dehydrogenase family)